MTKTLRAESVARFAERALPFAIGLFIVATPFAKVMASITHSFCILLFLALIILRRDRQWVLGARIYYIILASYSAVLLFSLMYTPDLPNGAHEVWRQITRLVTVLMIIELVSSARQAKQYLVAFVSGTVVLAGIGLFEAFVRHAIRPPTMWHPVHGANILLMGFVGAMALAAAGRQGRMPALLASLMLLMAIYWTETRGVWASVAVTLLLLPILLPSLKARYKILVIAVVVLSLVLLSRTPLVRERIQQALSDVRTYETEGVSNPGTSFAERLDMWKASMIMFREHPLFGIGAGGWREALRPIVDHGDAPRTLLVYGNPHNIFFNALSTRGIVGLLALCALLAYPLKIAMSSFRRPDLELFTMLLVCATAGFVVSGLTDTVVIIRGVFPSYLILIGIALSVLYRLPRQGDASVKPLSSGIEHRGNSLEKPDSKRSN